MKFYTKRTEARNIQSDTADQHKKARPRKLKARGPIYHSIHSFRHLTRHQQRRHVRVGLVLLVIMLIITGTVIYKDYHERPGILERSSLKATEAGTNKITLEWKGTRNTDSYTIYYKKKGESPLGWHKVTIDNQKGSKDSVTLKNLEEGTKYGVIITFLPGSLSILLAGRITPSLNAARISGWDCNAILCLHTSQTMNL